MIPLCDRSPCEEGRHLQRDLAVFSHFAEQFQPLGSFEHLEDEDGLDFDTPFAGLVRPGTE
jgi:hypothetical protein